MVLFIWFQSQKSCFSILKKFVELWADQNTGPEGFIDFMYKNIVPACFIAPTKESFDINDAQTQLALGEISNCLSTVYEKRVSKRKKCYFFGIGMIFYPKFYPNYTP